MILCDLPYGTTACKWDSIIPFEPLWREYKRIIKTNGAIVLTASQPFTSALVMSNPKWFRYEWIWEKSIATQFLDAKRRPLKKHENILIFSKYPSRYNPQLTAGRPYFTRPKAPPTGIYGTHIRVPTNNRGTRYPVSIQKVKNERGLHPSQKPVPLIEYLIRTYTDEGEAVLDNCMGSGTTGVACANTGRNFTGIERDPGYFKIAKARIAAARKNYAHTAR